MDEARTAVSLPSFKVHKPMLRSLFYNSGVDWPQPSAWPANERSFCEARTSLKRVLTKNIIPFWYPGVIDADHGGYRLNHDIEGRWKGPANKCLVTQARTLWFFSRLVNSPHGLPEHLEAAHHGYQFLRDRMWDHQFGGFYCEVDSPGQGIVRIEKDIYSQAFALYALTEYAMASGDASAKDTANEIFTLIETKAHDKQHGGYLDILARNWTRLSGCNALKRMNTHLHLLEALTALVTLTGEPLARERLIELILINSNSVVRKNIGACTDKYSEDWKPCPGPDYERVSYGHDVENIWLLMEGCKTAGISESLLSDLFRTLFGYAVRYGFDRKEGGFYESGFFNSPADRRTKIWWVQAEGLVAALQMWRLTGEQLYWNGFAQTLEWIAHHQADWQNGDWHENVGQNGKPSGVKAGPWKAPYHNGRAMLLCLDLLAGA